MSEIALSVAFIGIILLIGVFLKILSDKKGYPLTLFLLLLEIKLQLSQINRGWVLILYLPG